MSDEDFSVYPQEARSPPVSVGCMVVSLVLATVLVLGMLVLALVAPSVVSEIFED